MLQIAAYIFFPCFGVALIAWALCRGGSMVERASEKEAEIRRIRQQLGYEQ